MANTPFELTGSSVISIPELLNFARDGAIRIPRFQRSFVWDSLDVRRLFDSIYRGFPIGTVILWHKEAPRGEVSLGPIHFRAAATPDALWVVDGQQRIVSLFGTLRADQADRDARFDVYFDLSTRRFINPRRGVVPARAIPIREAIETRRLAAWARRNSEDLEPDDFDVADRLVGVLRDYRVSIYVVAREDERTLRDVFDRVNSAGKPITRAQVFQALFASDTQPGSPAVVVKELSRLGFGILEENRVVQSLLAIRGGNVQRDLHDEFSEQEDLAEWYDRTEEALARAVHFIRSEGVPHISLMPNTFPIPVLATFFYIHPEPEPWVLRLLARWLWRSWVNGSSSQTPALRKAVNAINPSAQGRLILLTLASQHPMRPNRTAIDLAAEFEQNGASALTELVRGHRSNAAARAFWPVGEQRFSGNEDPDVLASHVVDRIAASRRRAGDVDGFIQRRTELLAPLVRDFINSHLDTNALVRPPLTELIVSDRLE